MAERPNAELGPYDYQPGKCSELVAGPIKLNPRVTAGAAILLYAFVIACGVMPGVMNYHLTYAKALVPEVWSWLYIVSQDIWIFVLIYVMAVPQYGNLKLGKDDEEPEYSTATWFSMLFACGVATGFFYFSAEPMWHAQNYGGYRDHTTSKGFGNNNEDAIQAMMVTWYHWGVHGWIPYTTIGAVLGIMCYRRGFPMSIRYCFVPLIGEMVYGWLGDLIDILSIITTIAGICTSLGLGAMSLNRGLMRLNHGFYRGFNENIPNDDKYMAANCGASPSALGCREAALGREDGHTGTGQEAYGIQYTPTNQILVILCITLLATVSVLSGLNRGIVNLSRFTFGLGMFMTLYIFFAGQTWHILNVMVESFGFYVFYFFKVSFDTDAYELLGSAAMGLGGSPDGLGGGKGWMDTWTIFYWGWWISWGPFVGTFLARISKGRTLRQFILGTLILPSVYCFWWFGVYGGEQIRTMRQVDALGMTGPSMCGGNACDSCYVQCGDKTWPSVEVEANFGDAGALGANPTIKDACDACTAKLRQTGAEGIFLDPLTANNAELTAQEQKHLREQEACVVCDESIARHKADCTACQQYGVLGLGEEDLATEACANCGECVNHCMLKQDGSCGLYSGSSSEKFKRQQGVGYSDGACTMSKDDAHDWSSGNGYGHCEKVEWQRWDIVDAACIMRTSWVDKPCGTGADPTAFDPAYFMKMGPVADFRGELRWHTHGLCQDKIEVKHLVGPDRIFNLFSTDDVTQYQMDNTLEDYGKCTGAGCIRDNENQKRQSCFTPAPDNLVCYWWQSSENAYFDTVSNYGGFGLATFMQLLAVIAIACYFITSSDSGSFVVDMMSANGDLDPPLVQRAFWSFTEGICAMALLYSGKDEPGGQAALRALQSASIVMGLPFTFVLFWCSQSLVQLVKEESGEYDKNRKSFRTVIFALDHKKDGTGTKNTLLAFALPGLKVGAILQQEQIEWPVLPAKGWGVLLQLLFVLSFLLSVIFGTQRDVGGYNACMLGAAGYVCFAMMLSLVRREVRERRCIPRGDFLTDFLSALTMYPFCVAQMEAEISQPFKKDDSEMPAMASVGKTLGGVNKADLQALVKELVDAELKQRGQAPASFEA